MNVQVQPKSAGSRFPKHDRAVAQLAQKDLAPLVHEIDDSRALPGRDHAGARRRRSLFPARAHDRHRQFDLKAPSRAMSAVSEHCLSTGFCVWCQDALGLVHRQQRQRFPQEHHRPEGCHREALGGTGLSNPMKTLFGIER
jgi:hypothetical protein